MIMVLSKKQKNKKDKYFKKIQKILIQEKKNLRKFIRIS